jgi:gas vesicle protein
MSKLFALFAVVLAGAVAVVLFFRRKSGESWGSTWKSAKDSGSSWGETAAHESGKAVDTVTATAKQATTAVSDLGDQLKGNASEAAHEAGKTADRVAAEADDATNAATNLADEVKEGNAS